MSFINGNPLLSDERLLKDAEFSNTMTVRGTIQKTFILFLLTLGSAAIVWNMGVNQSPLMVPMMWIGLIGGLIASLAGIFAPKSGRISAPVYAIFEGLFLGAISFFFEGAFSGIVFQAIVLTLGVLLIMIGLYSGRIVRATNTLYKVVLVGTAAVGLAYLASFIMSFFGTTIPYIHEGGPIGIGFSLIVVVLAALSFIIDFDQIEKGESYGAPRYMEWYGAMSVMITLIWLYINILRLLSKLSSRD